MTTETVVAPAPVAEPTPAVALGDTLVVETEAVVEETPTEEVTEETTEEAKPKKSGFEKRVSKLNAKIEAAELAAEHWKREALKSQQATPHQAPPAADKPALVQFNNMEEYTDALTDWKINTKLAQQQAQSEQNTAAKTYQQRVAEFTKTTPDYLDVVSDPDLRPTPEVNAALLDSEYGPQMAYYLGNNPDELDRINALAPHRRLIEMGILETKVRPQPKAPQKATKPAPAPVKPVVGAAATTDKSVYEMTPQELMAHRNKVKNHR